MYPPSRLLGAIFQKKLRSRLWGRAKLDDAGGQVSAGERAGFLLGAGGRQTTDRHRQTDRQTVLGQRVFYAKSTAERLSPSLPLAPEQDSEAQQIQAT